MILAACFFLLQLLEQHAPRPVQAVKQFWCTLSTEGWVMYFFLRTTLQICETVEYKHAKNKGWVYYRKMVCSSITHTFHTGARTQQKLRNLPRQASVSILSIPQESCQISLLQNYLIHIHMKQNSFWYPKDFYMPRVIPDSPVILHFFTTYTIFGSYMTLTFNIGTSCWLV